jgi:dienelactone hydrolase
MRHFLHYVGLGLILLGLFAPQPMLAQTPGDPGPFALGYRDVVFTDLELSSPEVSIRIYYPAVEAGADQPVAEGTFPVVAFGHGFNLNYLDYENLCFHLASWGFIVLSPDVQNGFNVDHLEYANELVACIEFMIGEGSDIGSDFHEKVSPIAGVYGHSMGGGASYLVPSVYPFISAIAGLAPAETNPSAIDALANYAGPLQIISGSEDNVTPEATNQQPMYENSGSAVKHWVSLTGGAHCKFTDGFTICDLVSSPGSISREEQQALTNLYTTAFFRYYLQGEDAMLPWICGDSIQGMADEGRIIFQTTIDCTVTSTQQTFKRTLEIYPNPASNVLNIRGVQELEVFSVTGQRLILIPNSGGAETQLDIADWEPGLYWIRDRSSGALIKFIKH